VRYSAGTAELEGKGSCLLIVRVERCDPCGAPKRCEPLNHSRNESSDESAPTTRSSEASILLLLQYEATVRCCSVAPQSIFSIVAISIC